MQYVASVSGKGKQVDKVKEQLLQCNPILEGRGIIVKSSIYLYIQTVQTIIKLFTALPFPFSFWECQNIEK